MRKLRRLMQMSSEERRALIKATWFLVLTRVTLASLGFGRTKRLLERRLPAGRSAGFQPALFAQAVRTAAANLPFPTTCLDQAVALWWLVGGRLRIGVRHGAELEAHAWVERDGQVLLDPEAERFAAFDAPLLVRE